MVLCDELEVWDGDVWDRGPVGGRLKKEGIYVYFWLIHIAVQQKPTHHCKATILQLKRKKEKRNGGYTDRIH